VSVDVSTPVFEGPFDLLLALITKEQVDLYEVSLSRIVDAFLREIAAMQSLDLEVATEFLLIAATLVELKLRRLLPDRGTVDLDEELALLEERDLLLAKLLEYQTFRGAAAYLKALEQGAASSYPRTNVVEERFLSVTADPLAGSSAEQLRDAFRRVVARLAFPKETPMVRLDHVTPVRVTVAEAVAEMAQLLPRLGRATFRALTVGIVEPGELIVRFLAILELYKQGWVELDQAQSFGDLHVAWCPEGPEPMDSSAEAAFDDGPVLASATRNDEDLDDDEAAEIEAELEASIADARAERLAAGPTLTVDDYEG
jgi:segregation and condensation protein A